MPIRDRSRRTARKQAEHDLLETLIAAPPTDSERQLAPIVLRSASEQRRHALRGFMLRTWVDSVLFYAERLVIVAALLVFGYWLADGPIRDWLHTQQGPVAPPLAAVAAAPAARLDGAASSARTSPVLLPYTTTGMEQAPPDNEFLSPRQGAVNGPTVLAPQPTRLIIPGIALDSPVKEVFVVDGAWQVADYAAGYLNGTGLPGETGNTVLAGHAGLRGAVFRDLGALAPGDTIFLDAAGLRYHYRVRELKSVWPNQTEVLDPTTTATLTLLTCTNWDTQRLVVVADLLESKPSPRP
ncbi:MAG: sortase [Chloroflexi bacterium SZAS-1]|nr:sortase [Chloroflexi bacterium SZAS-1]